MLKRNSIRRLATTKLVALRNRALTAGRNRVVDFCEDELYYRLRDDAPIDWDEQDRRAASEERIANHFNER